MAFGRKKAPEVSSAKPAAQGSAYSVNEIHAYEAALQLLHQEKYDKALAAFEKFLSTAPELMKASCRMHIAACQRQLAQRSRAFSTPEEQSDYAASLVNSGDFEDAREQYFDILDKHPEADYAFYGLAVLEGITGNVEACIDNLNRAIELNSKCRLQARSDTDFQGVVDDPRFTELLYPEIA